MDAIRQIIKEAIQQETAESPTALRHKSHEILQKIEEGVRRMNAAITELQSVR